MRVARLERCIAQLGPSDTAELKSLQAALAKARAQTILPHPAQQVEDCQGYCTRATRRLEKARAAVVAAQEAVVRFEAELQEGLRRLEELKAAVSVPTSPPVNVVPSTLPSDHTAEVNLLRATVEELTRERDNLRARVPPQESVAAEPSQTVLAVVPVPTEPRERSEVMATLIEEADTDLRRQGRFTPY